MAPCKTQRDHENQKETIKKENEMIIRKIKKYSSSFFLREWERDGVPFWWVTAHREARCCVVMEQSIYLAAMEEEGNMG